MEAHTLCWGVGLMLRTTCISNTSPSAKSSVLLLSMFCRGVPLFIVRPKNYRHRFRATVVQTYRPSCFRTRYPSLPDIQFGVKGFSGDKLAQSGEGCFVVGVRLKYRHHNSTRTECTSSTAAHNVYSNPALRYVVRDCIRTTALQRRQ